VQLIQLWHAGGGFKAVGYCRFGKDGSPHPAQSCHKAYTTAVTGSEQLIKVFSEVFGIEREAFYPAGMPRLDGFLDEKKIQEFREDFYKKYPEFAGKKIILFAPTYRGVGQGSAYYDYNRLDLHRIYEVCGDEYVFFLKMHPFIKAKPEIADEDKERIFDFSAYPSINELYYVTELLITDYSSNFYEYSLMKKPILFYTYDRHIYELTRGVYRGVSESAPGKVCDTFDELVEAIRNHDFEYEKVLKFVEENFGDTQGCASDKVIDDIILKKLGITENDSYSN
jgi:CDP-ribitol ribitolphosphotransferase